ncbi:MAG: serine/threonine protein kinase [Phycisphaeraceae bacterium]|nr:serine/threonine protein kinase [Phycisphaeraceae bacterium]MBX3365815.1 serine/threonine protein kinase [Phycisphaeraceae bacterium]
MPDPQPGLPSEDRPSQGPSDTSSFGDVVRVRDEPLPEAPGYDLVEEIGRGGMGVVYEAYQRSTGRKVAIKFMRGLGRDLSIRFEREIDLLARLSIPGVVSVIDSGVHNGNWYYAMEHIDGEPLDERVQPGKGDVRETMGLVASVAEVVTSAHERGVLHRDLKPSNILVEKDGRVRLLDFGLAKSIDPDSGVNAEVTISEPGRPMGTLAYMPPEQASGDGASVRSDVYAIGVIAFYLLTGRHPIEIGGTLIEAVQRIRTTPIPKPSAYRPRVSTDIDAIISKATAKLQADRYATAAELASDIRNHLAGRPISARRVSGVVRVWRWVMRNRILVGVVGGALIAMIVMGIASFMRVVRERDRANSLLLETFSHFSDISQMEDMAFKRAAAAERIYGKQSRLYVVATLQYAILLEHRQRYVEAEHLAREALAVLAELKGISDGDRSLASLYMGRILGWQGKHDEAITLLTESRSLARNARLGGRVDPFAAGHTEAHAALFLGNNLQLVGRHSDSLEPLEYAYRWWAEDPPTRDDGWYTGAIRTYAESLLRIGEVAQAEGVLLESYQRDSAAVPMDLPRHLRNAVALADFYTAVGRADDAKPYRDEVARALDAGIMPLKQDVRYPEFPPE